MGHNGAGAWFIVASALLLGACAGDSSSGPVGGAAVGVRPVAAITSEVEVRDRGPQLGQCDSLRVPAGSKLSYRTYATGVQVYRWSGASWVFVAPVATLFPNAESSATVGTHYAGPTWRSNSGSEVVGTVLKRCSPAPNAIPWLLLGAVSTQGPGVFHRVSFIHRVNTVGGNAPPEPGIVVGEEVEVPYTAQYYFYRDR